MGFEAAYLMKATRMLVGLLFCLPAIQLQAQGVLANGTIMEDKPPAGAPTATCTVPPMRDASRLLVVKGDAPVTFVFACGSNRPAGECVAMTEKPGSKNLPNTARFMPSGQEQGGWSCVQSDSVAGWMPTDRLAALPASPAVPSAAWLGWWRQGKDVAGVKSDRLLITRSSTTPRTLHVSGRAYWYGLNNNIHFGAVQGDASAYGDTLLVVDGDGPSACTVVLVYQAASHTFLADDNMNCGGMNVRFLREWQRYAPGKSITPSTNH